MMADWVSMSMRGTEENSKFEGEGKKFEIRNQKFEVSDFEIGRRATAPSAPSPLRI
jgi:hypothetical protein